jgi:catechol 2,3-dioxygenase-like lactoylglutathione lyase family enzyme
MQLDHVQVAIPPGGEEEARRFFGGILGLAEIPKPEVLSGGGGCWFQLGTQQLHLGVESDFRPAQKAHIAVATNELDALRSRLADAGHAIREDLPIDGRKRFFTADPFGNRIEFVEAPVAVTA